LLGALCELMCITSHARMYSHRQQAFTRTHARAHTHLG
jgi:hypothetical protein